jgi:hypothetical protein
MTDHGSIASETKAMADNAAAFAAGNQAPLDLVSFRM